VEGVEWDVEGWHASGAAADSQPVMRVAEDKTAWRLLQH